MGKLTANDAWAIATKLKAEIVTKKKAHDLAKIMHNGVQIAQFGIRRGSGELGHGHIPKDIHLGPHETKLLAQCRISREEWLALLKKKGII